jgi:hypothetical protein
VSSDSTNIANLLSPVEVVLIVELINNVAMALGDFCVRWYW